MTTPILIGAGILLLIEAGRLLFQPSQNLPGNSYAASGRQELQLPAREPNTPIGCSSPSDAAPAGVSARGQLFVLNPKLIRQP